MGRARPCDRYAEEKRRYGVHQTIAGLPNEHDDTRLDRALVHGLRGEPGEKYHGCNWCHDLPWRRHESGCPGCGLPYAEEVVEHEIVTLQSTYPVEEMDPC